MCRFGAFVNENFDKTLEFDDDIFEGSFYFTLRSGRIEWILAGSYRQPDRQTDGFIAQVAEKSPYSQLDLQGVPSAQIMMPLEYQLQSLKSKQ